MGTVLFPKIQIFYWVRFPESLKTIESSHSPVGPDVLGRIPQKFDSPAFKYSEFRDVSSDSHFADLAQEQLHTIAFHLHQRDVRPSSPF